MNKKTAIGRLQHLRNIGTIFLGQSSPSHEFYDWRETVLKVLEEVFGLKSEEYKEFDALRFEPPAVKTAALEEWAQQLLPSASVVELGPAHYFREQLHVADEILLVVVSVLSRE